MRQRIDNHLLIQWFFGEFSEGEEDLGMESLAEHYERLLGLDDDWQVLDVELVLEEQWVAIRLEC